MIESAGIFQTDVLLMVNPPASPCLPLPPSPSLLPPFSWRAVEDETRRPRRKKRGDKSRRIECRATGAGAATAAIDHVTWLIEFQEAASHDLVRKKSAGSIQRSARGYYSSI